MHWTGWSFFPIYAGALSIHRTSDLKRGYCACFKGILLSLWYLCVSFKWFTALKNPHLSHSFRNDFSLCIKYFVIAAVPLRLSVLQTPFALIGQVLESLVGGGAMGRPWCLRPSSMSWYIIFRAYQLVWKCSQIQFEHPALFSIHVKTTWQHNTPL